VVAILLEVWCKLIWYGKFYGAAFIVNQVASQKQSGKDFKFDEVRGCQAQITSARHHVTPRKTSTYLTELHLNRLPSQPWSNPTTDQDDMATRGLTGQPPNLTFYPAYCFKASPTYFAWVKLTAFDIHNALHTRRGFEGQSLYFYLNHPIQFVYLVGVVVSYEDFHEKRWLFILDDSSGATIEVTCPKLVKKPRDDDGAREKASHEQLEPNAGKVAEEQARAEIIAAADVGSVIKVKGKIGTFRDTRQIQLERIAVVADMNAEVQFWEQRTRLKAEVLSKPWAVSSVEQRRLVRAAEGRDQNERARLLKRKEREAARLARERRHEMKIARQYEREEVKRREAAEAARLAGETLMASLPRKKGVVSVKGKKTKVLKKS
jgi:Telomere regulation protein Stn1